MARFSLPSTLKTSKIYYRCFRRGVARCTDRITILSVESLTWLWCTQTNSWSAFRRRPWSQALRPLFRWLRAIISIIEGSWKAILGIAGCSKTGSTLLRSTGSLFLGIYSWVSLKWSKIRLESWRPSLILWSLMRSVVFLLASIYLPKKLSLRGILRTAYSWRVVFKLIMSIWTMSRILKKR